VDDRQVEGIKEGAGLDESRVNQDFVDFLKKWSQPVLLLIVIVSGGWFFYQRYQQGQITRTNNAFAEYEAVAGVADPLPASLRALADTYDNVGSIAELSLLRLGDVHLAAVRRGLEPGAVLDAQGNPESEADVLDDVAREDHLDRAASAYRDVLARTAGDPAEAPLAVAAHFGLAAVAESRGDDEEARAQYENAASLARDAGLTGQPQVAEARIASLDALPDAIDLPSRDELPVLPGFPAPDTSTDPPAGDNADIPADPPSVDLTPLDAPPAGPPAAEGPDAPAADD